MTREELAARIMCAYIASDTEINLDLCFDEANAFLAYAAAQRTAKEETQQRKPAGSDSSKAQQACEPELDFDRNDIGGDYMVKCNHAHTSSTFTTGLPPKEISKVCAICGVSLLPEPPKPERKAREFILAIGDNGEIMCMNSGYLTATKGKAQKVEYITVREILPGDKHDK